MTELGRLPVVFPPETDERLSSWLARMATFYAMTVSEFLVEFGLAGRDIFDLEWRLSEGEGALIAARTGLSGVVLRATTFQEITPEARIMIARKNRHHCPSCPADVHRKVAALPWTSQCAIHGTDLHEVGDATLPDLMGPERFAVLQAHAKTGAAVLDSWAWGEGQGTLGPVEMLAFLTARHRRASPPNVSEQPRMSLGARRDYHAFLTTPINPAGADGRRAGIRSGRTRSDQAGATRLVRLGTGLAAAELRAGHRHWPSRRRPGRSGDCGPACRRRRRAGEAERCAQIMASLVEATYLGPALARSARRERPPDRRESTRRRQSHKYRRVQSHKYRYRIS